MPIGQRPALVPRCDRARSPPFRAVMAGTRIGHSTCRRTSALRSRPGIPPVGSAHHRAGPDHLTEERPMADREHGTHGRPDEDPASWQRPCPTRYLSQRPGQCPTPRNRAAEHSRAPCPLRPPTPPRAYRPASGALGRSRPARCRCGPWRNHPSRAADDPGDEQPRPAHPLPPNPLAHRRSRGALAGHTQHVPT
jgi:hypothetical protein